MSPVDGGGGPRLLAVALLVLLEGQGGAGAWLRGRSDGSAVRMACGVELPRADRARQLDLDLQLDDELSIGHPTGGTAVLVNHGSAAIVVLTTQAVLLAPAARVPVSRPERPRPSG